MCISIMCIIYTNFPNLARGFGHAFLIYYSDSRPTIHMYIISTNCFGSKLERGRAYIRFFFIEPGNGSA